MSSIFFFVVAIWVLLTHDPLCFFLFPSLLFFFFLTRKSTIQTRRQLIQVFQTHIYIYICFSFFDYYCTYFFFPVSSFVHRCGTTLVCVFFFFVVFSFLLVAIYDVWGKEKRTQRLFFLLLLQWLLH